MVKGVVCCACALNLFVFILYIQLVSSQLPADQLSSMTSIYDIIQNDTASSFVWSDVLKNSNPCSWRGVVCSNDNSSIHSIYFRSFSISTFEFLPFLCNISTLESIDVSSNQISSIPESFYTACGEISGLKLLNFSGNGLSGSLPSFNGFTGLESLDFSRNLLSGEISMQFDGLGSLKSLNIGWNRIRGKIPTNLGKMNVLEELLLSANQFTGEIPVEITKFKNLRVIDLSANMLSGSIPWELGQLTMLQTLVLSLNSLTGGVPAFAAANQNKFNGSIPSGITGHLAFLDLSYNELTGTIPSDLLSGENLQALDLSSNKLEGPIPPITSTKLYRLRLGNNSLNGTISSETLGSHLGLMYLELDGNSLSGDIPPVLGMLRKLALLNLAYNKLTGILPPSLGNLTNLQVLSLQLNNLVGEIPPQILLLSSLERLNISMNSLTGSIPLSISRMQSIRNLDLQGNNLSGSIPDSIRNLSSLLELQLGSNQLSGRIPVMPEKLQIVLNLSYNLFTGEIPITLSRLDSLEVLDLSNNMFIGEIPSFLTYLSSLTHLLLKNNNLSGEIPQFRENLDLETQGNNLLIRPPPRSPSSPTSIKSIASTIVIVVAMPVVIYTIIAIFISRRYKRVHGHLSPANSIHRSTVDFKKVMRSVSDPENIILKARFSTFYKAVMPSGTTYLVKKFSHSKEILHFPRYKELIEELEVYGNLTNANIMIPIAYVLTARRAYLVYEFAQGTLSDFLHHEMGNQLDWGTRYTIAIGVAQGLSFLHECRCSPNILLDLSSESILLKSVDQPQISDIELCKIMHPSMRRDSMSAVAASIGYAPPEYASSKRVTAAGNVYSFGVVLLELITGKPAVSGGIELAKWVWSISEQQDEWNEILDSSVSDASVAVRNQMLAILKVALACISTPPEGRPNAITLLQMLLSARLSMETENQH